MKNLRTALTLVLASASTSGLAQETTYTLLGTPGLIEMPSARSAPDGEIAAGYSYWNLQRKSNFTFQITPRLSGSFRYSGISDYTGPGTDDTFDRSFDLRYRILDEGAYRPAVAIGFQDIMGTGLLSGEYVVATKAVTSSIDVTAGIGWGRLGSRDPFGTPFGERPGRDVGLGGEVESDQFFKGGAAFFGGIDYRVSEKLSFQAEYSSDAYDRETANGSFDQKSPLNVGVTYRPRPGIALSASYLYGSDLAAGVTVYVNPDERLATSGLEGGPTPILPRSSASAQSWQSDQASTLANALGKENLTLEGIRISGDTARIRYANNRYRSEAQAMGRAARILTQELPQNITTLIFEPTRNGIQLSSTTIDRDTLTKLENTAAAADELKARVRTQSAAAGAELTPVQSTAPKLEWNIRPYVAFTVFDGDNPIDGDIGIDASATYKIQPNLIFSGRVRQSLRGARDVSELSDDGNGYPDVRTLGRFYGTEGEPVLQNMTLSHYSKVAPDVFLRGSVGYFEKMYGGAAAEVLWKPVDSKLALGAEVVYAAQRDFDMGFGFRDYDTVTAHVSAYYDFDNGFHGQIDVGKYLAGDVGATVSLDREFNNGWRIGGYFTVTDMPFDDFGEGSFDKGIRISAPVDFFFGKPSRRALSANLNSLSRDGGSRVSMEGRLYDEVRAGHTAGGLGDTWGRFWR